MKSAQEQLQQQYEFLEKLGHGAFGHIISVRSKNSGKLYACKIQRNHARKNILVQKQFLILAELMDSRKFPLVFSLKKFPQNSFVIMEKLGKTLTDITMKNQKPLSLKSIALIAEQLFSSLQLLHRTGYLHRDLKPQNIMTCQQGHQIKIIDFGLADTIAVRRSSALIGNVRFASRGAHFGYSSKMDDLEECLYVLYFLMLGKLPWQNVSNEDIKLQVQRDFINNQTVQMTPIYTLKSKFLDIVEYPNTSNLIKKAFYEQFHSLATFIFSFRKNEDPDYRIIQHKADRLMTIVGVGKGECFDWCQFQCPYKSGYVKFWDVLRK